MPDETPPTGGATPEPEDLGDVGSVVLRAVDITKTYGGTHALKGVNFDIHRGKVTTLFGENGAGKSTLMKILSGVERPTSGTIELDGEEVAFASAVEATEKGISIIHQELSLAPNLSVSDNIFMGRELTTAAGVDFAEEAPADRPADGGAGGGDRPARPRAGPAPRASSRSSRSRGRCRSIRAS